ncbi:MAG: hypothetical protein ACFE8E_00425 [Candidatus Hodarchaeota archaeon]
MKHYKLIFIGLTIISITFLILSLILGEFFIFFPFFFILPLSCGIRRRTRETINTESYSYGDMENYESEQKVDEETINIEEKVCPSCNIIILEWNLRFCPQCGAKLKN